MRARRGAFLPNGTVNTLCWPWSLAALLEEEIKNLRVLVEKWQGGDLYPVLKQLNKGKEDDTNFDFNRIRRNFF